MKTKVNFQYYFDRLSYLPSRKSDWKPRLKVDALELAGNLEKTKCVSKVSKVFNFNLKVWRNRPSTTANSSILNLVLVKRLY